jgi:PAS domain S-box-containing protein
MHIQLPIPENEKERIEALRSYGILDSELEKEFDAFTKLASYICQTPIAAISLIDENRQWFKSSVGLDVRETARDVSFCQHTIMGDQIFEVDDASLTEKFKNNPLVTGDTHIRFYAGVPLKDIDGYNLGSLCVIDTVPKKLSAAQLEALQNLSYGLMSLFNLRKKSIQLKLSEEKFTKIFASSPVGISISRNDTGQIMEMNDFFLAMLERNREEVIGKTAVDIHIVDAPTRKELLVQALKPKESKGAEITFYKKSGQSGTGRVSTEMIQMNGHECMLTVAYDVTERIQLEEKVRQNEEKFQKAFFASAAGITVSDLKSGILTEANTSFLKMIGRNPEEVIGRKASELNLLNAATRTEILEEVQQQGYIKNREVNYFNKDREAKTGLFSLDIITVKGERSLLSVMYDITERKQKEEAFRELFQLQQSISDSTDLSIISLDLNGIIKSFNKGAEKMLGYKAEEVIGLKTPQLFHDRNEIETRAAILRELGYKIEHGFEIFQDEKNLLPLESNEWTYIRKDGVRIPVQLALTVIKNKEGIATGYMGIAEDITLRKKSETDLKQSIHLMEQSISLKETFLANMSHEIRTPLNAILGFTNLLLKKALPIQEHDYIRIIKSSGENLLRIINDILDVSKLQSGLLTFEEHPLDIKQIFQSLRLMLGQKAEEKNLQLSFSCSNNVPDTLIGDPTRLTQIILNIVGNAIKFTNIGSVVLLAEAIEDSQDAITVKFSVTDTGIGIRKDKLTEIFERFKQAESNTTRNYGGTGLGLCIVKDLVELQGGQVTVSSEEGIGSVFTFTLPFKKMDAARALEINKNKDSTDLDFTKLKIKRVLLVEDNPVNITFMLSLLEMYGLNIEVAENGQIAVEKIKKAFFDVVLMDIEMPKMNGYEAAKIIRTELTNPVPIIAMTAHAMAGEADKCFQSGMDDYISKPVNEELLIKKMYHVLFPSAPEKRATRNRITNLSTLEKQMRGKKSVILEIIDAILLQSKEEFPRIHAAIAQKEYSTVKQLAHKMRSTVLTVGAMALEKTLEELETSATTEESIHKVVLLQDILVVDTQQFIAELEQERVKYM